jgi:two-component system sensor histidine kinase PrrB
VRPPAGLRARIVLAATAALLVVGIVAGFALVAMIERDGRRAVDRELTQRVEGLVRPGAPGRRGGGPGPPPFQPGRSPPRGRDERLLAGSGTFVQVALDGQVVEQRGDVPANPPQVPDGDGFRTVDIGGAPWRSLTLTAPGGARVQILSTLEPVQDRVARVRGLVLALGLAALLATGLTAWAFTGVAIRPLARLRDGAARVSGAEDLTMRLPEEDGPDEVRSLATALNGMLARLGGSTDAMQRALTATRRFAADAGHELRTPLTGMRANLDALDRNPDLPPDERAELVRETLAEQDRIVALLEGLQALTRGEAAESLPREDVELADLVDTAVFAARRRHPAVGYELDDAIGDATVNGWAGGLRLLVDNLLANAAVHGRPGGRVRVGLTREDGVVKIAVDDDGPGLPADERLRVLEPFARGSGAGGTEGTGLGLAIVAQQAALHGGAIELGESPLGGLAVTVRLPVA